MTHSVHGPMIITKEIGPTSTKGDRVKAIHQRDENTKWTKTVGYNYNRKTSEKWLNHLEAAQALVDSWPYNEYGTYKLHHVGYDHKHHYFTAQSI